MSVCVFGGWIVVASSLRKSAVSLSSRGESIIIRVDESCCLIHHEVKSLLTSHQTKPTHSQFSSTAKPARIRQHRIFLCPLRRRVAFRRLRGDIGHFVPIIGFGNDIWEGGQRGGTGDMYSSPQKMGLL